MVILCNNNILKIAFDCRVTLGNQLDGVKLLEPDVVRAFKKRYPNGFNTS